MAAVLTAAWGARTSTRGWISAGAIALAAALIVESALGLPATSLLTNNQVTTIDRQLNCLSLTIALGVSFSAIATLHASKVRFARAMTWTLGVSVVAAFCDLSNWTAVFTGRLYGVGLVKIGPRYFAHPFYAYSRYSGLCFGITLAALIFAAYALEHARSRHAAMSCISGCLLFLAAFAVRDLTWIVL